MTEPTTSWFSMDVEPAIGRKVIVLFSDGSGCKMAFRHDDGYLDEDGADCDWAGVSEQCSSWTYLPPNFEFWCEIRGDDCVTLPKYEPQQ